MDETSHIPVKGSSDRAFGLLFSLIFFLHSIYPSLALPGTVRVWSLLVATGLGVLAVTLPRIFHYPNRYWMKLGLFLGAITSPIVLGVLFFALVTPVAFISRRMGSDPLRLGNQARAGNTYWINRDPSVIEHKSMSKQY